MSGGSSILPCKSCDVPRRMMEEAGRSWNAVCGVNFREARAGERALFSVVYTEAPNRPTVLATSFYPDDDVRMLCIHRPFFDGRGSAPS